MVDDARLHPDLGTLLRGQGWDGLTAAQEAAADPLLAGEHVLLVAPTGHGKTEAALLPVLSRLLAERDHLAEVGRPWPTGFKALYITPLRALNRDLMQRLTSWSKALGIDIAVRHGDTTQAERARQSRRPPDLLITTPETVQLLLYGDRLRSHLRTVRFVIVDEVHAMAASERGAQLAVALERIEEVIAQPPAVTATPARGRRGPTKSATSPSGFQRIGLSATVAGPAAVAHFLVGRDRPARVVKAEATKRIGLDVILPAPTGADREAAGRLALPPEAVAQLRAVRGLVQGHERVLVFVNTRDAAELLVNRSAQMDEDAGEPPLVGLHHGSLSPAHRAEVEDRFKAGGLRGLVATSSLELGIDVGAIDHVVQIASPRSVGRLVQRLGRAGHRVGAVSQGTMVATGVEDAMECMAIARAAIDGRLETVAMREGPLVVLANQLVALSNEYAGLDRDWTWHVVTRAAPFEHLDEGLFDAAWSALIDLKTLFPDDERPDRLGRSGRGRRHFLEHVSLIPDETTYRVVDEATKRSVGTVDDAFVAAGLHPGAVFVMAGRTWQVLEIDAEGHRVRVAATREAAAAPQWSGSLMPVSAMVAAETARLRHHIARRDKEALRAYPAGPDAIDAVAAPVFEQLAAGLQVPTDRVTTVEHGAQGFVVHVPLGTRGNEALGRITQALLHQRLDTAIGMDSDAYRIDIRAPSSVRAQDLLDLWASLDPDTLDLLVAMLLRGSPVLKHHLVHVAKHFGALPKGFDPNRFSQTKLEALMSHLALQEETMDRLVHDRLDLDAVASWLRDVAAGAVQVVVQGVGPLARLSQVSARGPRVAPSTDEKVLAKVRERIEASDVLLLCTGCRRTWPSVAGDLPRRPRCRRCGSIHVACLRPWHEGKGRLLGEGGATSKEERLERDRIVRNGGLVASFGKTACLALVGRGIGPDTAARILQKSQDTGSLVFWREILLAELAFARTSAYWSR